MGYVVEDQDFIYCVVYVYVVVSVLNQFGLGVELFYVEGFDVDCVVFVVFGCFLLMVFQGIFNYYGVVVFEVVFGLLFGGFVQN